MKFSFASSRHLYPYTLLTLLILSCSGGTENAPTLLADNKGQDPVKLRKETSLSSSFKEYWYAGEAELTSYKIEQARYGELREGHAVLVYVTEPFLKDKQVKADQKGDNTTSVLKLNTSKKYLTGIYPYSIMTSTFYPVSNDQHALKISNSVQEWCGHVYSQLNNREGFDIMAHSYFESEADQDLTIPKTWLENEFWTMLRIDPASLPEGEQEVIPDFEYIRTGHLPFKAQKANITHSKVGNIRTYTIDYKDINRKLVIEYSAEFPYKVQGWKEQFLSGFGTNAKELTSTATIIKSIKSPYWQKNKNKDVVLRDSLGLN